MIKKKINKKRHLKAISKEPVKEEPLNPRLEALQNRELVDEQEDAEVFKDDKEVIKKEVSKWRLALTWFLTIVIGTIVTYILVVLGAQLSAGVASVTLAYQSVLSSDALLISSTAFTTSIVWALIFKVKLYERLFDLFSRRFGGK